MFLLLSKNAYVHDIVDVADELLPEKIAFSLVINIAGFFLPQLKGALIFVIGM